MLAFFSARLEQHPDQTLSVGVVLDVIKQGTLQWPRDRLKVNSLALQHAIAVPSVFFRLRYIFHSVLQNRGCLLKNNEMQIRAIFSAVFAALCYEKLDIVSN